MWGKNMKIEKNKLVKVFWKSPKFSNKLKINGTKGIILDSIEVVECERGISNFPHYISVEDNGDILITPIGAQGVYFVTAERAINADVLEIKTEDYIRHYVTMGGTYEFVLNNKVDNNFDDFLKEYTHE